jgi:hypothetical protein
MAYVQMHEPFVFHGTLLGQLGLTRYLFFSNIVGFLQEDPMLRLGNALPKSGRWCAILGKSFEPVFQLCDRKPPYLYGF